MKNIIQRIIIRIKNYPYHYDQLISDLLIWDKCYICHQWHPTILDGVPFPIYLPPIDSIPYEPLTASCCNSKECKDAVLKEYERLAIKKKTETDQIQEAIRRDEKDRE